MSNSNQMRRDSRSVMPGDIFLAMPGERVDGRNYIDQAIRRGASCIYYEAQASELFEIPKAEVPCIAVENLSQQEGFLAAEFYDFPTRSLCNIGVTGTNGKTSITHFIAQCLADTALVGTLGYGSLSELKSTGFTTPMPAELQQILHEFVTTGIKNVAMEVSSHALSQGRVNGVDFDIAVFSNLSHDHLDYHKTFDCYKEAKQKLFAWPTLRYAIINQDDPVAHDFINCCPKSCRVLTYSIRQQADIYLTDIQTQSQGYCFTLHTPWGKIQSQVPLVARFNLQNMLAVVGVLGALQTPINEIGKRLTQLKMPKGRLQLYHKPGKPTAVIDFAHTPDALTQVLAALREHCHGRIITVVGCGGDRDPTKRRPMGEAASALSDKVIITNDNPRHESPEHIATMICEGVAAEKLYAVTLDRKAAILQALAYADEGDVVLIAGKGHETYQIVADQHLPFCDGEVVAQALEL